MAGCTCPTTNVVKAFDVHLAEEVNEALLERGILKLNNVAKKNYKGRSFVPTNPVLLST